MNFRKAFISMLAAGAVAVTGVAPASATMNPAKPAVPVAAIPAPIQVRDHIVTGNEVVIRRGHRYWNGHRGHRYFRHGYRRHYDGYWYPGAAFGLGIIIAPQPRRIIRSISVSHINWCYARYRSYREYDNSWKPNHGPRRVCVSPYY